MVRCDLELFIYFWDLALLVTFSLVLRKGKEDTVHKIIYCQPKKKSCFLCCLLQKKFFFPDSSQMRRVILEPVKSGVFSQKGGIFFFGLTFATCKYVPI